MNKEELLYEYLKAYHKGKKNAVHSKELQDRFKICSRTVRAYVNNLRKAGYPICSNDKGYWIAKNSEEANQTVKRLGDFVGEINSARTGLAVAAVQMRSITTITEENIRITVKVG